MHKVSSEKVVKRKRIHRNLLKKRKGNCFIRKGMAITNLTTSVKQTCLINMLSVYVFLPLCILNYQKGSRLMTGHK